MSDIANAKRNWLDQVKEDAEAITRERLARELPKLKESAERIEQTSAPEKAKKESK